jgi:hypothetical protein
VPSARRLIQALDFKNEQSLRTATIGKWGVVRHYPKMATHLSFLWAFRCRHFARRAGHGSWAAKQSLVHVASPSSLAGLRGVGHFHSCRCSIANLSARAHCNCRVCCNGHIIVPCTYPLRGRSSRLAIARHLTMRSSGPCGMKFPVQSCVAARTAA